MQFPSRVFMLMNVPVLAVALNVAIIAVDVQLSWTDGVRPASIPSHHFI